MARTSINIVEREPFALAGIRITVKGTKDLATAGGWATLPQARADTRCAARSTFLVDVSATDVVDPLGALTDLAASGHPVLVRAPCADLDLVQALLETGARGVVERSAGARETLGALRLVARGESYVPWESRRGLQGRFAAGERSSLGDITPREWQIIESVAVGRAAPEIARELSISLATVRTHLSRVYAKLGVTNNVGAVSRLFDLGLLHPDMNMRAVHNMRTVLHDGPHPPADEQRFERIH